MAKSAHFNIGYISQYIPEGAKENLDEIRDYIRTLEFFIIDAHGHDTLRELRKQDGEHGNH